MALYYLLNLFFRKITKIIFPDTELGRVRVSKIKSFIAVWVDMKRFPEIELF